MCCIPSSKVAQIFFSIQGEKIIKEGFPNAFVVAYENGNRMTDAQHNPNVIKINEGERNIPNDQKLKKLV